MLFLPWKRSAFCIGLCSALVLMSYSMVAQAELSLPRPSPLAKVTQQVGVTDISVTYFSPGKRGRAIWGGLVPYGQLWRTGANGATVLSLSHDATIGGTKVKAGTYAIFSKPGQTSWWVMINTNYKTGGTRGYHEKNDVAKFEAKPQTSADRERLTFLFENTTENSTDLCLEWAGVKIAIPIQVDTKSYAAANIDAALKHGWRPYFEAARHYYSIADYKKARTYIDQALALHKNWWNSWLKAQIMGKQHKLLQALKHAKRAQKLGANDYVYKNFFAQVVAQSVASWSAELARQNAEAATSQPAQPSAPTTK